jgi:hypothetical protein
MINSVKRLAVIMDCDLKMLLIAMAALDSVRFLISGIPVPVLKWCMDV